MAEMERETGEVRICSDFQLRPIRNAFYTLFEGQTKFFVAGGESVEQFAKCFNFCIFPLSIGPFKPGKRLKIVVGENYWIRIKQKAIITTFINK